MTENQNIEWKENWQDEYIKWICGFANAHGGKLIIGVNDDKLVLWNDGQLPENGTIETLNQKHPTKPYNPDIANAFFRTGLIDAWVQVIQKINSECQRAGSPVQDYRYDYSGFFLVFNVSSHDQSVKTLVKILEAIKSNDRITIPELVEIIGVTTRSIERNIQNLQQNGKLIRIGPAKGGHWEVIGG